MDIELVAMRERERVDIELVATACGNIPGHYHMATSSMSTRSLSLSHTGCSRHDDTLTPHFLSLTHTQSLADTHTAWCEASDMATPGT